MYLPTKLKKIIPSTPLQQGFALIPLLVLLVIGITTGTLLIQNGTNFLPKAQQDEWNPGNDNVLRIRYEQYCYTNSTGERVRRYHIKRGNNLVESKEATCDNAARPCGDFMKQFCASNEGQTCYRDSAFEAECTRNTLTADYYRRTGITDARTIVFPCSLDDVRTNKGSQCSTEQNLKIDHCDLKSDPNVKIVSHESCLNTETPDSYNYYCHWSALCSGTQQSPTAPAAAPAAAAPAAQPAAPGQANGISSTACSDAQKLLCQNEPWQPKGGCVITTTGLRQCKYEANREGAICNNDPAHPETGAACGSKECRVIDGLPRCITNTCTEREKTDCQAKGATCEIGTKKIGGVDKNYTYCKPGAAQPQRAAGAPAAAQSRTGAAAPAAGAPAQGAAPQTSSAKTPWDIDSDGNSSKVSEVLKQAAQATSGSTDNASDAIDAARKARSAYLAGFDEAYNKVFQANISSDADARKVRDEQANFVAIHAYVSKEYPGVSWADAKQKGYDYRALENLRRAETGWVIPQNATVDLSKIKAPGDTSTSPARSSIDRSQAVECGYDADGLKIPCFQVGVFASYDDLQAVQSQATIAVERYQKSRDILKAVKGKVDEQLLAVAEAKLKAAEEKANACLKK